MTPGGCGSENWAAELLGLRSIIRSHGGSPVEQETCEVYHFYRLDFF